MLPRDSVDRLIASWQRVRPDLDIVPVAVVARLARVRAYIDVELERVFSRYHLGGPDFSVLVTLARLNEPGGVPQRRLMDELGLTSGTVSVRIDRLAELGLVSRAADPRDKRNSRISLTEHGRELFERVVPAHLENERRLLSSLSDAEADLLASLLRKLLVEYEGTGRPEDEDATLHVGLVLAAAHVTAEMRKAVGLPSVAGLLVRGVADGGPAALAGIQPGDVLVRAGQRELRSVTAMYKAIEAGARRGRLRLTVLRGTSEYSVSVALARIIQQEHWSNRAGRREHVV